MRTQRTVGGAIVGAAVGVLVMGSAPHLVSADVPVENKTLSAVAHSSTWTSRANTARAAFDNSMRSQWCPRGTPVGAWLAINLDQNVTFEDAPQIYVSVPMTLEMQVDGKSVGTFGYHNGKMWPKAYRSREGSKVKFIIRGVHGRGTPCIKHVKMKVNDPDSGFYWRLKFKLGYDSWGAFAVNRNTGRWAYEMLRSSKKAASKFALNVCGSGCELIVAWNKKCAAIVRVNRKIYFGYGNSKAAAQRNASKFCMTGLGVRACAMTTAWACSLAPR